MANWIETDEAGDEIAAKVLRDNERELGNMTANQRNKILERSRKLRSDLLRLENALALWDGSAPSARLTEYRARNLFDSARHYWAAIAKEFA